ncbi:hypothetical protein TOPH_07882 [Tolypocladium ophioglossoides CBS 100239]|uniref:Amine oxidase domain-containing protein n=1 Tax=Tolypocladium ophioglossoides (strain CBS 100239) TaxID=1163406 RepID=A0A0L0N0X5_TOLOC|nr:hypothetical protein TOPH_07882 [Tolypocladium ophioglossoides CBS 100239]
MSHVDGYLKAHAAKKYKKPQIAFGMSRCNRCTETFSRIYSLGSPELQCCPNHPSASLLQLQPSEPTHRSRASHSPPGEMNLAERRRWRFCPCPKLAFTTQQGKTKWLTFAQRRRHGGDHGRCECDHEARLLLTRQALSNASISDFVIIEYQEAIGGRVHHTKFGAQKDGSPYTIELGANWIQGLGHPGGPVLGIDGQPAMAWR